MEPISRALISKRTHEQTLQLDPDDVKLPVLKRIGNTPFLLYRCAPAADDGRRCFV